MAWQENLFGNLLVVGILLFLGVVIYAQVRKKTLADIYKEILEINSAGQQYE